MAFLTVNYVAIVLAAAAAWIFGAGYYGTLGPRWMAAQGKTVEQCKAEMAGKSGAAKIAPFILSFVAVLIIAYVLYGIMLHIGLFTLRAGLVSGALTWFGFVLTTMTVNNAFCGRRTMLTVIDAGHWLGAFLIIGAIVGAMGR